MPAPDLAGLGEPLIIRAPADGRVQQISRMLRGACALPGGRAAGRPAIAALDRQLALTVAGCDAGMLPGDRARVESAAAS